MTRSRRSTPGRSGRRLAARTLVADALPIPGMGISLEAWARLAPSIPASVVNAEEQRTREGKEGLYAPGDPLAIQGAQALVVLIACRIRAALATAP